MNHSGNKTLNKVQISKPEIRTKIQPTLKGGNAKIVWTGIIGMILIYGIRHSFAVFFTPILEEFTWSRGNISIMMSLNIFIYGFLAPVAGILADRWRPRILMPLGIAILGGPPRGAPGRGSSGISTFYSESSCPSAALFPAGPSSLPPS
jgi:MFS family permease